MHKTCPKCGETWSIDEIISNPEIEPIGMIVKPDAPLGGVYFFVHNIETCQTSFAVPFAEFTKHIEEAIPTPNRFGSRHCSGHCRRIEAISVCAAECKHAPYRRFLVSLYNERRKHSAPLK